MRWLTALVAGVALVPTAGCLGPGANSEDEQRVEIMTADPLLTTVAPGGSITRQPDGDTADSEIPWTAGGGTNSAGAVHEIAGTVGPAARFYADVLVAQGWTAVQATCTRLSDTGRTLIGIGARRWYEDFEGWAFIDIVEAAAGQDEIRVVVSINAPFHTETGDEPSTTPPQTDCLDALT